MAGYPARDIANLLFLSLLTLCVLFMPLNAHLHLRPYDTPVVETPDPVAVIKTVVEKVAQSEPARFEQDVVTAPRTLMSRWNPVVAEVSQKVGISADWIRAVMHMESGGRTTLGKDRPMRSAAGAMGLMQLMPKTYAAMRDRYGLGRDAYNPRDNILAGAAYLRILYKKYGYPAMFAAYNAGPGYLEDHLHRGRALPNETRNYVKGVTRFLGDADAGTKSLRAVSGGSTNTQTAVSEGGRVASTYGP